MGPRRVCSFALLPGRGGLELNLFDLARSLDPTRYHPLLVSPFAGPMVRRIAPYPITVLPPRKKRTTAYLADWLKKNKVDLVHTYGHFGEGALAALALGIPHLWEINGFFQEVGPSSLSRQKRELRLLQQMAFLSQDLVVPSRALQAYFQRLSLFRVHHIPNGIDAKKLQGTTPQDRHRFRRLLKARPEDQIVAMVGNFYLGKRHKDFLRAGALLCRKNPRVRLVIAGRCFESPRFLRRHSQRHRNLLIRLANSLGLGNRLRMIHYTEETRPAFFKAIDLLLSPAKEGFGLAAAEALALGKPVVAANQGGSCDLIEDNVSGRLVPLGNPRRMAEAALELLEDEPLARRLGKNAAGRIRRCFTLSLQAQRTQRLYDQILASHQGTRNPYRR